MTLADKIWEAIQRVSPPVTHEEVAALVRGVSYRCGSVITVEDLEDHIVKTIPEGWARDPRDQCYRPIRNPIRR